jgi:hypothetical protein
MGGDEEGTLAALKTIRLKPSDVKVRSIGAIAPRLSMAGS